MQKHKIANFVILVLMKGRGYHWVTPCICRWQIFQVQFLSNEETIFAFLFRLKVQQSNYRCTKDLNGFAKNWTCCGKCKNLIFTFMVHSLFALYGGKTTQTQSGEQNLLCEPQIIIKSSSFHIILTSYIFCEVYITGIISVNPQLQYFC